MKKSQKGFSVIELLLIVIVVGLLGFIGWYVWQSKNKTDQSLSNASNAQTTNTSTKSQTAKKHTTAEAIAYTQEAYGKYIAAQKAAESGPETADKNPALTAMKSYLSESLYTTILNYQPKAGDGAGTNQVLCNQFGADSVTVTSKSSTADIAILNVETIAGGASNGNIPVTVDLATLKITAITCPA